MTPTRLPVLLFCALVAAVGGYLLAEFAYGALPPLPVYAPVTLLLLALAELGMARVVRDRVRGAPRPAPGGRPPRALHPLQVARAAALAKASSPAGALLVGAYAGLLAWTAPRDAQQATADARVAGLSALAALALVVAALVLERACRTPEAQDRLPGLRS